MIKILIPLEKLEMNFKLHYSPQELSDISGQLRYLTGKEVAYRHRREETTSPLIVLFNFQHYPSASCRIATGRRVTKLSHFVF